MPRPLGGALPDVPAPVVAVIARCLRKAPAERFASAAELVGALDTVGATVGAPVSPHATWWRVHQIIVIVLYASRLARGRGRSRTGWRRR